VLQDLRLAFRLVRRTPLATGVALLSIALSVGATAVVFTAVKAVLIEPLPYAHPNELVSIRGEFVKAERQSIADWVTWNDRQEITRRTRTLQSIGAYSFAVFDLAGSKDATPEALYGLKMTANLFPTLGVSPMIGRNVLPEEDQAGHPDVMILSYGLWVRRFNSDRNVVGRTVAVNGHDCLVIGVMPPEFNFPLRFAAAHTPSPYIEFWAAPFPIPKNPSAALGAVARLRPGVSLVEARQDIASVGDTLTHDFPEMNYNRVLRLNPVRDQTVGVAQNALLLLMGAAVLFMLIGCANVANLLLARGFARQREIAVRLAMGAGTSRILRQLLTESVLLAVLGGLGGYTLTAAAWKALPAIAPAAIPRLAAARADSTIFGFALGIAALNGVLFGMAPALRLARGRAIAPRDFGARGVAGGTDRVRSFLVISEVALSVLLVVAGGQLVGSFVKLISTDPGFQADRILSSVVLPEPERYPDPAKRGLFYKRILDAVRALPGVESAGTVDALPFSGENHGGTVSLPDGTWLQTENDVVGGEYLQALGIRLLEGRWFREEDMSERSDSAIVSDFVANRFWPGASAVGQRICLMCAPGHPNDWKQIVGVVSGTRHIALNEGPLGNVYTAAGAMQESYFVVVRTQRPTGELEKAIRRAIANIDPNQPVFLSTTMTALIADSVADRKFIMLLLAITACLALIMSTAGIYGVVSYTTSRRTQEFGVRVAVGATPRDLLSLVFSQGFMTVTSGIAIGIAAALATMHSLRAFLVGLESTNSSYLWMASALVASTAALACWIPARRASRMDPCSALRQE
jgi:predicted permease